MELSGTDMRGAFLVEADLTGADLSGANLREALLGGTKVSNEQLATVKVLEGATMPNGEKFGPNLLL